MMDWFEYNQFGNLSNGPNGDPDSDGFSNKQENELGQEANIKDSVQDGEFLPEFQAMFYSSFRLIIHQAIYNLVRPPFTLKNLLEN